MVGNSEAETVPGFTLFGFKIFGGFTARENLGLADFFGLHTGRHEPAGRRPAASAERHIHTL